MITYAAIAVLLSAALYATLFFLAIRMAIQKDYPLFGVVIICLLATPLVGLMAVAFAPLPHRERRLSVEELTAVLDAKADRLEAERAASASRAI